MVKYLHVMTGTSLPERALDQVLTLQQLVARDLAAFEARHGLTTARVHLLWVLGQQGPLTQRALAEGLGVSARNVTGLVDALVATGHLTRERHPTDRRARLVTLTPRAEAFVHQLQEGHRDLAARLFGDLSPERLTGFVTVLEDTVARFRELVEEEA
jgi:DNA-binding MarR family transcriptional regulator